MSAPGALADRVVIVTGGGRGLGRVIAGAMSAADAIVVVVGRDAAALDATVAELAAVGGRAEAVVADVTDHVSLDAMAAAVLARHGRIDVLVNNSGIAGPSAALWEQDPAGWDETFAVNVRGVFLACRAVLPSMVARGSGSIVTIGSMTGKRALSGRSPYAASKTALIGLTRTLATEAGEHGIRVNLVSPGGIEGERIERVIANLAAKDGITLEEARRRFTDDSPLGRMVTPDDVAGAVVFLASDVASGITGEDLNVSAGTVMY
jgi:NAD(P)-dependent dehydrogenase (short-subunit alcohol dehydrogenase family)